MASILSLIRKASRLSHQHSQVVNELWAAYEDRYGTTPNDHDIDELIDVTDYGHSAGKVTMKEVDRLMKKAGYPRLKKPRANV